MTMDTIAPPEGSDSSGKYPWFHWILDSTGRCRGEYQNTHRIPALAPLVYELD
jgi:hypothetical protein